LANHLNELFHPLEFPPELASRVLTHLSHRDAVHGHNARLAFLGRRAAESCLLLWLHSLPPELAEKYDYSRTTSRMLNTYVLGEHVAPRWGVTTIMRWSSNVAEMKEGDVPQGDAIGTGLFKVAGTAVEAVLGGIWHQFGGSVAHRVFHTRLFPYILLPGTPAGLPDTLLDRAQDSIEKMGGLKGKL
ncbi:ribonuclease-III-like-domain-containing protein, partial [Vararia minispora EC-137]